MLKTIETKSIETVIKKENKYYLFVRWKKGVRAYGPDTSTYNGNRFEDLDPSKQLINLLKLFSKDNHKMAVALLYDSSVPKYQEERDILKWCNGVVEVNRINCYKDLLQDFQLPDILK